jgi:cytochrome c553
MNLDAEDFLSRKAFLGLILAVAAASLTVGCGVGPMTKAQRGEQVFKTCTPCHGAAGTGNIDLRAPAIGGLPEWYVAAELTKFKTNVRGAHPDDTEGHRMRPMARTLYHPGDLEAVAAYVAGLPKARIAPTMHGDAAAGQKQYGSICIACHGADATGTQAMNAPPLAGQADWYLYRQLEKFKSGMRGAHPDDVTGSQMRAMSTTLADTMSMLNVVAYIKTLSH